MLPRSRPRSFRTAASFAPSALDVTDCHACAPGFTPRGQTGSGWQAVHSGADVGGTSERLAQTPHLPRPFRGFREHSHRAVDTSPHFFRSPRPCTAAHASGATAHPAPWPPHLQAGDCLHARFSRGAHSPAAARAPPPEASAPPARAAAARDSAASAASERPPPRARPPPPRPPARPPPAFLLQGGPGWRKPGPPTPPGLLPPASGREEGGRPGKEKRGAGGREVGGGPAGAQRLHERGGGGTHSLAGLPPACPPLLPALLRPPHLSAPPSHRLRGASAGTEKRRGSG